MKIIKSSNNKQYSMAIKKFTCKNCGCEFECDEGEYWDKAANTLSWGTCRTYMTCCPECHKVVEESEPNYTCTFDSSNVYTYTTAIGKEITGTTTLSNLSTPTITGSYLKINKEENE